MFSCDTYSIDVSSVDQSRESESDSISQLLLISQTNLTVVVHLGSNTGSSLQRVLGSDTKLGDTVGAAPAQADSSLQLRTHLLED